MVESITFLLFFASKKHPSLENLYFKNFALLKLFVSVSPNEFFSSVILFADFFDFLVSFSIFHFCRSVVSEL